MGNPFCDPLAETKLRNHPKTKNFMDDEVFRLKLRLLRQSPNNLMNMINDPQIMEAMGVLLGVDLTTMSKDGMLVQERVGRGSVCVLLCLMGACGFYAVVVAPFRVE